MKRIAVLALVAMTTVGCTAIRDLGSNSNPYQEPPFYAKYLNTGSTLDAEISATLAALSQNPDSPELHNLLGTLLVEKGFPNDAEREFERSVNANRRFHPAWYNLGLVRAARGDEIGAGRAFNRTVALKPGHAMALFQLGLVEEKREHLDRAIALYAKAYSINRALLDVEVNPRILDTRLTPLALLLLYPTDHARNSMQFQGSSIPREPQPVEAASPQAAPQDIITPAPPVTDPSQQPAPAQRPPGE